MTAARGATSIGRMTARRLLAFAALALTALDARAQVAPASASQEAAKPAVTPAVTPVVTPAAMSPRAKGAKPSPAKLVAAPVPLGPDGLRLGTDLAKVGDSILARTTWPPAGQVRFVAAARGKRLVLDLARIDLDPRKDSARARAYRQVIPSHSPLKVGTPFTLHGKFGTITTRITGFDVWSSRVVATLEVPPAVDSLARKDDKLTAVAERVMTTATVVPAAASSPAVAASPVPAAKANAPDAPLSAGPGCARDSLDAELRARERFLKDSLDEVVRNTPRPAHTGFSRKVITRATRVLGCFGVGRLAMAMMLRDDRGEWFVERVVIVDDRGKATAFKVVDFRFRAHEILGAYDVDGDGIDEIATRATTERAGAVTILKLDLKGKKLERMAAGFAWEDF